MRIKIILAVGILLFLQTTLVGITWQIKQDGSGDFTEIQAGIEAAANTDTVLVYPGTYYEHLDFNGKNITLASLELTTANSAYIDSTIIDGQRERSCIRIRDGETNARIRGLTIQNGYGWGFYYAINEGGGILVLNYSTVYVTNCKLINNYAILGGGIYARRSTLHLAGTTIRDNSAAHGGGIYFNEDSQGYFDSQNRCSIYNNNAGSGADIFAQETGEIEVVVDTFTVAEPSRYFVDYFDENPFTFDIQNHWMELVPHDMYVAPDGDDSNSGLSAQEPLRTIAWAVRKVYADSLQPRTVHVAAGTYSHQGNGQIYPIGCKNYVSIIGEDMENTFLFNDYAQTSFASIHTDNIQLSNFTLRHSEDKFSQYVIYIYKTDVTVLKNLDISYNTNIRGIITNEFINNTQYDNLTIKNNISYYDTPGLLLSRNSGYLRNSVIEGNIYIVPDSLDDCSSVSTAMHLGTPDNFTVENCVFRNNSSPSDPWVNWNQIIRVRNNNNTEASITFNNCLIADNTTASDWVFRIFNYDGTTEFNNCTFANNTADPSYSHNTTLNAWGDTNIINTIMHDNTAYEVFVQDDTQYDYIYKLNVKNSNIKGGIDGIYNQNGVNTITWGEGNMMWDPQFVGTGENPYQLSFNSLCIDAGTPDTTGLQLPSTDLLGNERIWDGDEDGIAVIDIGCYEYGAPQVDNDSDDIPQLVENYLSNYPNPFNPSTTINFSLPHTGFVKISVYNSKGRRVRLLVNDYYAAGKHTAKWKGRDDKGNKLASGVYLYRLQVDGKTQATRKCLLLK